MKIFVDTNVIIDILLNKANFVEDSQKALELGFANGDRMYFSSSSVTDVYYLLRKAFQSKENALDAIKDLVVLFDFVEVNEDCILKAIDSKICDFEDAVIDAAASKIEADYILTRNVDDFKNSLNLVINPTDFIKLRV
ncbi:MAG: PIN domain-containing protein [Bacilli bacterium]|nr:PIN domain-containing protein [Bacilli bacterium]